MYKTILNLLLAFKPLINESYKNGQAIAQNETKI